MLDIGPVLHLDDAVGSKATALLGRGLPRDYIDIAAALQHLTRARILELAFARDPGLPASDAALVVRRLDQLPDAPFRRYGLSDHDVATVRHAFADWPRDAAADHEAAAAHAAAQGPNPP